VHADFIAVKVSREF